MKTTKKHFELFKTECDKWIKKLELSDWDISIDWVNLKEECNFRVGLCEGFGENCARICLDKEIPDEYLGDKSIIDLVKETAKHEVIHVLVKNLEITALSRFVEQREIALATESLVRKLEKTLI